MEGIRINNGFIDFSKVTFKCPVCSKEYDDSDDKYLKKINKKKEWYC